MIIENKIIKAEIRPNAMDKDYPSVWITNKETGESVNVSFYSNSRREFDCWLRKGTEKFKIHTLRY